MCIRCSAMLRWSSSKICNAFQDQNANSVYILISLENTAYMASSLIFFKYFSNPGLTVSGSEMAFLSV